MADQTFLSKQKAALRLDVSEKTIDRLRSSGALEWIHVGSRISRNALAGRIQRGSVPGVKRNGKCYVTRFDLAWHGLVQR